MNEINNKLPLCVTCCHADRAPMGYVEACGIFAAKSTLQKYGRCAQVAVSGVCADYKPQNTPQEAQKPA